MAAQAEMTPEAIEALEQEMREAAARNDFETAAELRNRLFVARQSGSEVAGDGDFGGLSRQQPGAMGIGSQHPARERPSGWTPPRKPDPMTRNTGRRDKRRSGSDDPA